MKLMHYGLQRSGTNFLETLLKHNYKIRFLNQERDRSAPTHKHWRLYDDKSIIPEPQYHNDARVRDFAALEAMFAAAPDGYLVTSKDPYSWYTSYLRWAKRCNWEPVPHHYIREYNLFYGKFLELAGQTDKILFVRYADMVRDPEAVLGGLEERLDLEKSWLARFGLRVASKVPKSVEFTPERRAYYLEERYLDELSDGELHFLNQELDEAVARGLGYEIHRR